MKTNLLKQLIIVVILLMEIATTKLVAQEHSVIHKDKSFKPTSLNNTPNKDSISCIEFNKKSRQGFVTSAAGHIQGIYAIAYFHEIKSFYSSRGDILLGLEYQNQKTDDGQFNGISLVLGYRQFLFKKLCLTENFYPNYNHFESSIDGETYVGIDGFNEISIGWEFEISLNKKISFALTPQFTYGQALFRTNPWPRHNEKLQTIFFPDIYVSITF